jgi:hypothetical protein
MNIKKLIISLDLLFVISLKYPTPCFKINRQNASKTKDSKEYIENEERKCPFTVFSLIMR